MKKSILVAILLGVGWVSTSQAVVIHWAAVTGAGSWDTYTTASLVYVDTANVGNWAYIASQSPIDSATTSSGAAVNGANGGVYQRDTGNVTLPGSGAYYVVLFNNSGAMAVSKNYLDIASPDGAIGYTPQNPGSGVYTGGGSQGWTPVPEPGTLALVGLGAAALVIRRRRMRK